MFRLDDALGLSGHGRDEREKLLAEIDKLVWDFEYEAEFELLNGIRFRLGVEQRSI